MLKPHLSILFVLLFISSLEFIGCDKFNHTENDIFWTEANSPEKIGRMVIDDLMQRPELMMYETDFWTGIHYAEACAGFGAVRFAGLLNDPEMILSISDRFEKVTTDSLVKDAKHVDANVYGILPLELYLQTREERFLKQGLELADGQWLDTLANGLTYQTRYWIDDVWMIGSLQVQAYRATGKHIYLDRAAKEIVTYIQKLQQPDGLFHHGENAPFYWGRGNGWVAAGLAELLTELPENNPYYAQIAEGFKKMMSALLKFQADDGMWRQLIDKQESWKESSSTAMFGYAVTIGVKKGFLSKTDFRPVYQKAWESLVTSIDERGRVMNVCAGTGKSNDINYYLNRPRIIGDLHGQAPVLWFAYSLLVK